MMNFDLTPEQQSLQQTVRRFVADKVVGHARSWDKHESFPHALIPDLAGMGLLGICVDPVWGGAGLGALEMALVVEELARGDGSLALTVASHNGLCVAHIAAYGTAAQKERYLPLLTSGAQLGAWGLTEPSSGSDAAGMLTTAVQDGDTWVLNGSKVFITQGTVGGIFVVLAMTDKQQGNRGITAFIVEKNTPGFSQSPIKDKMGMRASDTAMLHFDAVRIPLENRLGALHEGFINTLRVLDKGRITIAALALGLGRAALAAARKYVLERKQFGRALAEFQATQWKLADMYTELEAACLLIYRAAWLCDQGKPFSIEASMAKLFASEAALRAADKAVQMHGGYGYTAEFPVERMLRDAKLCTIGEGTSEIQRHIIGHRITHAA